MREAIRSSGDCFTERVDIPTDCLSGVLWASLLLESISLFIVVSESIIVQHLNIKTSHTLTPLRRYVGSATALYLVKIICLVLVPLDDELGNSFVTYLHKSLFKDTHHFVTIHSHSSARFIIKYREISPITIQHRPKGTYSDKPRISKYPKHNAAIPKGCLATGDRCPRREAWSYEGLIDNITMLYTGTNKYING